MTLRQYFTAASITACLALASAGVIPRQSGTTIEFCTKASYSTGACPYAQPTTGTGTCGNLTVASNVCYTFDDFPDAPSSLIDDVNYIYIPDGAITGCNLYKTTNCTVTPDEEWDACEVGGTDLTCRKHLAGLTGLCNLNVHRLWTSTAGGGGLVMYPWWSTINSSEQFRHFSLIIVWESVVLSDAEDNVRALTHHVMDWVNDCATPQKCRAGCDAEGYGLAAVEHGQECWCGNTIVDKAYPVPKEKCDSPCAGDANQTCGGYGYMNLYARNGFNFTIGGPSKTPPEGLIEVSCFNDTDAYERLLPYQPVGCQYQPERLRTAVGCMDDCSSLGYKYAGLQNGRECWCGYFPPPLHREGGKCDMPCEGDATQLCGGSSSLMVYCRGEY
ncbi:Putative fungistatic metabolite [Cytospora mali]|uniref:Fungistatic metabolite n=1 Tax=Cytospora mali TaxID=578113 RepID=A0A194UTV9_CYTMA|nr:Putative fungistatic metabolite [Valsa mali var. pyri (nom. inval.)]